MVKSVSDRWNLGWAIFGVALFSLLGSPASADSIGRKYTIGIGVQLGEPTGIVAQLPVADAVSIDFGLAYSFAKYWVGTVDAVFYPPWYLTQALLSDQQRAKFPVRSYLGVGAVIAAASGGAAVGVRIPLGIEWFPRNAPIQLYLELVPVVMLAPATAGDFQGGIGVRFLL